MDEFEKVVKRASSRRENLMISNASIEHAEVLARHLMRVAIKEVKPVKIFTGCLEAPFYDTLIDLATEAMNKGCALEIIVENPRPDMEENAFFSAVQSHDKGTVMQSKSGEIALPHFILVGSDAYRLETDHNAKEAKANFGDPMLGGWLVDSFEETKASDDVYIIQKPTPSQSAHTQ